MKMEAMELTRFDENDYSQGLSESPNGEWVRFSDADAQISRLREALRAAEEECAGWRKYAGICYGEDAGAWYTDDAAMQPVQSADTNDTIRAKLGLPKIGGGQ